MGSSGGIGTKQKQNGNKPQHIKLVSPPPPGDGAGRRG